MRISVRRAVPEDARFLVGLYTHEDVEPFLAVIRPKDIESVLADIGRSDSDPDAFGVFVVEVDGQAAGAMGFTRSNQRSRIADLGGLAIHPDFRGRRIADEAARMFQRHLLDELGFHRLQLEIYAFNERAQAHADRAGFTREGTRRKAYWRDGKWVDGVLFGLVAEDLGEGEAPL